MIGKLVWERPMDRRVMKLLRVLREQIEAFKEGSESVPVSLLLSSPRALLFAAFGSRSGSFFAMLKTTFLIDGFNLYHSVSFCQSARPRAALTGKKKLLGEAGIVAEVLAAEERCLLRSA